MRSARVERKTKESSVLVEINLDGSGNVYICDYSNNRIRKITLSGVITTIAGTGVAGFSGDGGLATNAKINGPICLVIDATGNVFFTDSGKLDRAF